VSETPDLRLVGEGPAAAAVEAALDDCDGVAGTVRRVDADALVGADLGVAVGRIDGATLRATTAATDAGTPVVGVEIGGVGGRPVAGVDAAALGLSGVCYDCVQTRVTGAGPETDDGDVDPAAARLAGAVAGRSAVARLRGESSPLFPRTPDGDPLGGVVEVPHATRRVLPVPGCVCDDGRRFSPDTFALTERDRDLAVAVERAELALDERVGPLSTVGELESFPVPYYVAALSETDTLSDVSGPRRAGGAGAGWNRALMRALGEGLERYAAAVYRTEALHEAPPATIPATVGPDAFVRPDDAEAVDPDAPIEWIGAVDLAARLSGEGGPEGRGEDDHLVSVPAEAALFPPPSRRHLQQVTTGLGLGSDPVDAVLSGLTEVIERDAAMLSWYSTYEPLALAVDDERYETLARRARSEDLQVTALLVTVDIDVPVVVAAVHRDEWPCFAVGTDAAVDPTAAARTALTEALQSWTELRSMGPEQAREEPTAIARYADDPGPARRLLDADGPVPADSVADEPPESPRVALSGLIDRLGATDLRPYVVPLTPRDVERAGFTAVRVLVPGAQPLFVDVDSPVFGERATRVPAELGFEPRLDRSAHPFP
jgi:ribosomal protein S12 methylthiotransferase accessory factor